jgi:hypothetical protein
VATAIANASPIVPPVTGTHATVVATHTAPCVSAPLRDTAAPAVDPIAVIAVVRRMVLASIWAELKRGYSLEAVR